MGRWRPATWMVVACCALGAWVCGAAWALSSPVGSSPDEPYHLTSIWCSDMGDPQQCEDAGLSETGDPVRRVPSFVAAGPCYAFHNEVSGSCQDKLDPDKMELTNAINTGDYPSGFYRTMSVLVGDEVGQATVAMRLANVSIAVLLFALLALAATPSARRAQTYALAVTLVPLGWFLVASVNPSGWAIAGVTAFGFATHSLFLVSGRARLAANAALALLATAMAVSSRGDAAIYVGLLAVAVCTLHWPALRARPLLGIVPFVCCLISAWSALSAGQVASVAGASEATARSSGEVLVNLLLEFPSLVVGSFGIGWGLGWLDTPMPYVTGVGVVGVVSFLVVKGLSSGGWRKLVVVAMVAGAMLAIPMWSLYRQRLLIGEGVQPRYMLPLIPMLLVLVMSGRRADQSLWLARRQVWIACFALTVANSAALYTNLRRYVTGFDNTYLLDHEEWWWSGAPAPLVVWVLGSLGFAVFAASIALVSRRTA